MPSPEHEVTFGCLSIGYSTAYANVHLCSSSSDESEDTPWQTPDRQLLQPCEHPHLHHHDDESRLHREQQRHSLQWMQHHCLMNHNASEESEITWCEYESASVLSVSHAADEVEEARSMSDEWTQTLTEPEDQEVAAISYQQSSTVRADAVKVVSHHESIHQPPLASVNQPMESPVAVKSPREATVAKSTVKTGLNSDLEIFAPINSTTEAIYNVPVQASIGAASSKNEYYSRDSIATPAKDPVRSVPDESSKKPEKQLALGVSEKRPTKSLAKTPCEAKTSVKEPSKSSVKVPSKSSVKEPSKSSVKEPSKSSVKEPSKSSVKEPSKSPVKEPSKAPGKHLERQPTKSLHKSALKSAQRQPMPADAVACQPIESSADGVAKLAAKQPVKPTVRAAKGSKIVGPAKTAEGEAAKSALSKRDKPGNKTAKAHTTSAKSPTKEAPPTANPPVKSAVKATAKPVVKSAPNDHRAVRPLSERAKVESALGLGDKSAMQQPSAPSDTGEWSAVVVMGQDSSVNETTYEMLSSSLQITTPQSSSIFSDIMRPFKESQLARARLFIFREFGIPPENSRSHQLFIALISSDVTRMFSYYDRTIDRIARLTGCWVRLKRAILNRRTNGSGTWARFAQIEIDGSRPRSVMVCDRLLREKFQCYEDRRVVRPNSRASTTRETSGSIRLAFIRQKSRLSRVRRSRSRSASPTGRSLTSSSTRQTRFTDADYATEPSEEETRD